MTTYYVHKGVGADGNNGLSWATAFASLTKANATAGNNDTIWVRAGATPYYEKLDISHNGQRWLADVGNLPIMDGKYHEALYQPGAYRNGTINITLNPANSFVVAAPSENVSPALVLLSGDDNEFKGFFVRNVAGRGITITGNRNTVRNCKVDFCWGQTLMIINTNTINEDNLVEDCELTRAGVNMYAINDRVKYNTNPNTPMMGTPTGVAMRATRRGVFRRLVVHHSQAEAVVLDSDSKDCVVEHCVIFTNGHMSLYFNESERPTMRFNVIWTVPNPEFLREDNINVSENVVVQDETPKTGGYGFGQMFYGNLSVGGKFCYVWSDEALGGGAYVGYNTFVGIDNVTQAVLKISDLNRATVYQGAKQTVDNVFENNVIYAPGNCKALVGTSSNGFKARNNIIYQQGTAAIAGWLRNGPGTILADPGLVAPRAAIVDNGGFFSRPPSGTNTFNRDNYKLTGSSPAIGHAALDYPFNTLAAPLAARQNDLWGATRIDPDCGAHEFGGQVTPSVTAAFSRNPAATTVLVNANVEFVNGSFAAGGATITAQTWRVRKAGALLASATTEDYSYKFLTAGSYTVELEVRAGALSDSEIVAYTVTESGGGVTVTAAFSAAPPQTTLSQGQTVVFTGQSTVANGTLASQAWEVLALPGLTTVATGTGTSFSHTFATAGSWRARLTATAATGQSDTEQRDYTVQAVTTPTVTADFTSSDADGVVDEGAVVVFTNASVVTGTTVALYTWAVAREGSGTAATATTTNFAHTFAQGGVYTVMLRVDTAAGISDLHAITITVRRQATVGMDCMVVPATFAVATTVGTQTITTAALGGKTPKGAHVRLVGSTADGTAAAGLLWAEGATDGTRQWAHARYSGDSVLPSVAWRRRKSAALVLSIGAGGAVTGEAVFGRFVAGGMEIEVTDAFPAGYLAEVTFYAGDALSFWAGEATLGAAGQAVAVATGIDQDAVYVLSSWAEDDAAEADATISRGWAVREGTQYYLKHTDRHGKSPTQPTTRLAADAGFADEGEPGLITVRAGSFTSQGFSLTPMNGALYRTAGLFAFATGGYGVSLGLATLTTSGATVVELPFEAQTVQALASSFRQNSGKLAGTDATTQGWYSQSMHGPSATSLSGATKPTVATAATRSLRAAGFRAADGDGANVWNGTGVLSETALTISWSTQPAYAYRMLVLAVEVGTVVDEPTEGPVAEFAAEVDINTAAGRAAVWFDSSASSGNGSAITAWLWEFGDGTTSTEAHPFHLYEGPGEYTVSLTVTTAAGTATKTAAQYVVVEIVERQALVIGPSRPLTSGGHTGDVTDENGDHSHRVVFDDGRLRIRPLATADEVTAFLAEAPDDNYALMAWDEVNLRLLVKTVDGVNRAVATVVV